MTRRLRSVRASAWAFLLMLWVRPVAADPLRLTGGSIIYSRSNAALLHGLTGDRVTVEGSFGDFTIESWNPSHACFNCQPGKRINVSQTESVGSNLNPPSGFAFLTTDNVRYESDSFSFQIDAGDIIIPNLLPDANGSAHTRFLFHGAFSGTSDQGVRRTFDFIGNGHASIGFLGGGGVPSWMYTAYGFEPTAATPEPVTFFLVGTAVSMAFAFRRTYFPH